MSYPPPWQHWPQHPPSLHNGHAVDHAMLIGQLMERTSQVLHHQQETGAAVGRIEHRLVKVDSRMDGHAHRIAALENGPSRRESVPAAERWIKDLLRWALPLGTLWATGSIERAVEVMVALK